MNPTAYIGNNSLEYAGTARVDLYIDITDVIDKKVECTRPDRQPVLRRPLRPQARRNLRRKLRKQRPRSLRRRVPALPAPGSLHAPHNRRRARTHHRAPVSPHGPPQRNDRRSDAAVRWCFVHIAPPDVQGAIPGLRRREASVPGSGRVLFLPKPRISTRFQERRKEQGTPHVHGLPMRFEMASEKFAKLTRQCATMPGRTLFVWMVV